MGPLFRPVALSCGHHLCADCVEAALAAGAKEAAEEGGGVDRCPLCRADGALGTAVELAVAGRLLRARRREDWEARPLLLTARDRRLGPREHKLGRRHNQHMMARNGGARRQRGDILAVRGLARRVDRGGNRNSYV